MSARRGFTLLELAIVLTVTALVLPGLYLHWRSLEGQLALAHWDVSTAEQVRTVYEELARDARLGQLAPQALEFRLRGSCASATWEVSGARRLTRAAPADCGGVRTLATGVEALRRVRGGVELDFAFEVRPDLVERRTVFLPVEEGR